MHISDPILSILYRSLRLVFLFFFLFFYFIFFLEELREERENEDTDMTKWSRCWKLQKKTMSSYWRVVGGKKNRGRKTEKSKTCVGRQQEKKSGQQCAEVKATLLLGDRCAAGRLAVKKTARPFGDLEAT